LLLQTVSGLITAQEAGRILEHEHVLVGFVEDGKLTPELYNRDEVVTSILPFLLKLEEAGCGTMVDCAPEYLGRDPYILRRLSELSGIHLITNTGLKEAVSAFLRLRDFRTRPGRYMDAGSTGRNRRERRVSGFYQNRA
jgi:predicted metal-dependent phosphotriesterase family hydrolase